MNRYSAEFQVFAERYDSLNAQDRQRAVALARQLERFPNSSANTMPTQVGNILAAVNERPILRYGLDPYLLWPHLRPLLPSGMRQDVDAAQAAFSRAVQELIWGLAFVLLTPLAWWALPAGLAAAAAAVWLAHQRAQEYADQLGVCWNLYRFELYRQFRWPLPATPAGEAKAGNDLSYFVGRGAVLTDAKFAKEGQP